MRATAARLATPRAARPSTRDRDNALVAIHNLWRLFQLRPELTKPAVDTDTRTRTRRTPVARVIDRFRAITRGPELRTLGRTPTGRTVPDIKFLAKSARPAAVAPATSKLVSVRGGDRIELTVVSLDPRRAGDTVLEALREVKRRGGNPHRRIDELI